MVKAAAIVNGKSKILVKRHAALVVGFVALIYYRTSLIIFSRSKELEVSHICFEDKVTTNFTIILGTVNGAEDRVMFPLECIVIVYE